MIQRQATNTDGTIISAAGGNVIVQRPVVRMAYALLMIDCPRLGWFHPFHGVGEAFWASGRTMAHCNTTGERSTGFREVQDLGIRIFTNP